MIVSFIGTGQMGEALLSGGLDSGNLKPECVYISDIRKNRLRELKDKYKIRIAKDNISAVKIADIIILAIKPQGIDNVLDEMADYADNNKAVVSIVAGVDIERIARKLYKRPQIIRVMPNNPALLKTGLSAISSSAGVSKPVLDYVSSIFSGVGEVVFIDEKYQNLVTALSGSGPAYFYLLVRSLIKAGTKFGLETAVSEKLIKQTAFGAAQMVKKSGKSPEELIKMVASPGGTTEAALAVFEKLNFEEGVSEAVKEAMNRAFELGEKEAN